MVGGARRRHPRGAAPACAASRIAGVAVDATSGTVLLTDGHGDPLTPGLMYDDRRATEEVERVNVVGARVWERLGYQRMQPNWALPKLLWLLRELPTGSPARGWRTRTTSSITRLVGHEVATDLSNALKTGAHLIEERWPTDVLDALGVPAELLPDVVRPGPGSGRSAPRPPRPPGIPRGPR